VLGQKIELSLSASKITVNVEIPGMVTMMNKLQSLVTQEIFRGVIDKLQSQIDSIKNPMDTGEGP